MLFGLIPAAFLSPRTAVVLCSSDVFVEPETIVNGSTLIAELYDESFMPAELRKAHRENDTAVMQAYGFNIKMTESECVAELFKLYEKLSKGE